MFRHVLRCFGVAIFIFAFTVLARAQQPHFVYLQTENGEPFYVKINNKIISSSYAGYLILPKLTDGDYKLSIGFPKKEFPEEDFQISIDKKNQGFLLKSFGEKGFGLFNMQSYRVVMGGNAIVTGNSSKNLQDDPFSKLLANVVKDSSILQKNEPAKEGMAVTRKVDSSITKIDSITAKTNSTNANVDSTIAAKEKGQLPLLHPTRFLNKKNKDGREMIYIDHNQNQNDTIRIFIPSGKSTTKTDNNVDTSIIQKTGSSITSPKDAASATIEEPATKMKPDTTELLSAEKKSIPDTTLLVQQENKNAPDTNLAATGEKKNIPGNTDSAQLKKMAGVKQPEINLQDRVIRPANKGEVTKKDDIVVLPKVVQSSAANSDCKTFASNEDFLKLRKKMASENSDDNMIKIAKKAFHSKCFSTEQIKNLSFLFLTNQGKYIFFDAGYPFASDSDQYNTLQSQLTDSYYINRFKAMIHK